MELNIMGMILALLSISYVTLTSWCIGHLGRTPYHLAFSLSSGLALLVAAFCGLFNNRKWRPIAFAGILLFGSLGILLAMPSITLIMLSIDLEEEECEICEEDPLLCNGLCRNYKSIHVGLFFLTLLVHVAGSVLWSSTCFAVFRKSLRSSADATDAVGRRFERHTPRYSSSSNSSPLVAESIT